MKDSYAALLTIRTKDYTTVLHRYQSRWPKETVWDHEFLPFTTGAFLSSRSGGQSEIEIQFPLLGSLVALVETAIEQSYLFELELREFDPPASGTWPARWSLAASYLGQVASASYDESAIVLGLGSTLDPVEASAPPRVFTSALAGRPPKL